MGKALSSLALSGESEKLNANDLLTGIQNVANDFFKFLSKRCSSGSECESFFLERTKSSSSESRIS